MQIKFHIQRISPSNGDGGALIDYLRIDKVTGSFEYVEHAAHSQRVSFIEAVCLCHVAKLESPECNFFPVTA